MASVLYLGAKQSLCFHRVPTTVGEIDAKCVSDLVKHVSNLKAKKYYGFEQWRSSTLFRLFLQLFISEEYSRIIPRSARVQWNQMENNVYVLGLNIEKDSGSFILRRESHKISPKIRFRR